MGELMDGGLKNALPGAHGASLRRLAGTFGPFEHIEGLLKDEPDVKFIFVSSYSAVWQPVRRGLKP